MPATALMRHLSFLAMLLVLPVVAIGNDDELDLVITGGRVIDPESGLDAIRNVGIRDGDVVMITEDELQGAAVIDASGLVVAPGFIDIHAHGQNIVGQTYQVMDGVTTALDLEVGNYPVAEQAARTGQSYINFGGSARHWSIRHEIKANDPFRAFHEPADARELQQLISILEAELEQGAIGIGLGLDYFSKGVTETELEALFALAAEYDQPIFVHIRSPGNNRDLSGFTELIEVSRKTGAHLHMVHITSTGLGRTEKFLQLMDQANAEGVRITSELYPYTAGSTGIGYGLFDHDWQRKFGIGYGDVQWAETGERFTGREMWEEYRSNKDPNSQVILHMMKEEWIETALKHPDILVASDGMSIEAMDQRVHPRGMGTYSRILGLYVREREVITLQEAIRKISYLPAQLLEDFVPAMKQKGRIRPGSDADITIFDPETIIDRATFADPNQFSEGIEHVLVAGQRVVSYGELQQGIFPGQHIRTLLYRGNIK